MKTPLSFHQRIAQARASLGLLQLDVSRVTGIAPRRLSRLEEGVARAREDELEALASFLQMSPEELLHHTDWESGPVKDGWTRSAREVLKSYNRGETPQLQPSRNFGDKLEAARRTHSAVVRRLEDEIARRPDARELSLGLSEIWCDSALEVPMWLHFAACGARALWTSPLDTRFRLHPVTDWDLKLQAGDVRKVALWHPDFGILFPQVSLLQPKCRVDCLVALGADRFRGSGGRR
jgi:transcriptional regulator with XRE-family HTH domain